MRQNHCVIVTLGVFALVSIACHAFGQAAKPKVRTLKGHSVRVASVAFSPDGKMLASGSWDNTVKLWDVKTGK
jgi:WD40 repeat protein